jgi:hypothetical protein
MLAHGLDGNALQVSIQRGGDARAGLFQQFLREVRGDAVLRDVLVVWVERL